MDYSLPGSYVHGQWTSTKSFLWAIGSFFSKGKLLLFFISLFFKLLILCWSLANRASLVAQKVKDPPAMRVQPWSGGCPGEGHDNPLQYPCLENPVDRGCMHGVAERQTGRSD